MANVKVDTKKMQEMGNDIIRLSLEFNEAINMLYSRISSINSENNSAWVGSGASEFVRRALIEKKQYVTLKDQLKNNM